MAPTTAIVCWLLTVTSIHSVFAQETCPADGNSCLFTNVAVAEAGTNLVNQHFYIGGLFGVHERGVDAYSCDTAALRSRGIFNLEAFIWAIREYGGSGGGVSVGGLAMDSCSMSERTLENILSYEICKVRVNGPSGNPVSPRNLVAYVGPDRSSEASAAAALLREMNRTLVSHAATSPLLTNGDNPFFLRTVPSDKYDVEIMTDLLKQLQAKYVQAVYIGNSYGRDGFQLLSNKLHSEDICIVAHQEMPVGTSIDTQIEAIVDKIIQNKVTRYVVLYLDKGNANIFLNAFKNKYPNEIQNFIFFGTSSWAEDKTVSYNTRVSAYTIALDVPDAYTTDVERFYNYLDSLKPKNNTWNPWFKGYWDSVLDCDQRVCDENTDSIANRYSRDVYVPYTLMATKAVISGVKAKATEICTQNDMCSKFLNERNRGQNIYEGISQALENNERVFDNQGDVGQSFVKYKVIRVQNDNEYTVVGTYRPGSLVITSQSLTAIPSTCPNSPCTECNEETTTTSTTTVATTSAAAQTTTDKTEGGMYAFPKMVAQQQFTGAFSRQMRADEEYGTRFEIGQRWIIAIGVLAGLGILSVVVFEIYILYKLMGTKIGRQWRTMWLGQLLLCGIFLAYLTLFAYILVPTKATCGITRFGVGVSYAIIFAVLLVKLMVILTSKSSDSYIAGDIESPNYLKGIYQFLMFIFAVGVQIVIDTQWLIQVPPDTVKVVTNNGDEAWVCNHFTWSAEKGWDNMAMFIRTNFENDLLSLVYIMFLILMTTIVAMKAHGIITNHRESVFIGIGAGFSIPIWIAWGLVGGLNRDHDYAQEFGDACMAFGLFVTATLALFSMFLPKVRQLVNMGVEGIYLEDDRDTYYAGSVIMAPPSYKSRPSSMVYVNQGLYSEPVVIGNGDQNAVHLKHPGSTYSLPIYTKKGSELGGSKVLRVTGDLTGKHPTERRKPVSEYGYYRKTRSESGGTLRKSRSQTDLGAL